LEFFFTPRRYCMTRWQGFYNVGLPEKLILAAIGASQKTHPIAGGQNAEPARMLDDSRYRSRAE
jgi:hypothetical protein